MAARMTECNTSAFMHPVLQQREYAPMLNQNIGTPQNITLYQQQLQKHNFDQFIANEMRRMRSVLVEEESSYVKEKLAENPVELEHRNRSPHNSGAEENAINNVDMERGNTSTERLLLREQRAASCRKSRINNKLKKASVQYRNEFMAEKVSRTKNALSEIRRKIKSAEQRLLARGYTQAKLAQLRAIYGFAALDVKAEREATTANGNVANF